MLPASTTDTPEDPESSAISSHPIHQIKALIAEAKHAIWQCGGPEQLEPMLCTIAGRIAELPALGNPQAIAPLTQQFLSLIETKPEGTPDGKSVLIMVKHLGYTPEFIKIYSRALSKEVLDEIVAFMANDPLMVADLKSTRMVCQLARRGASAALIAMLDRMLDFKNDATGPGMLEALSCYMADEGCDVVAVSSLIKKHREFLWTIPDFKAKTAGVVGIGFLNPKAAWTLYQHGEVELARELVKVMCKQAQDPNHYYFLEKMGEAPSPDYFKERFFKRHIFCEEVLYSIQNSQIEMPLDGLSLKQGDSQLMRKIIDGLPKLHLDSEVEQDRMIEIMQAVSADHSVNQQMLAKSGMCKHMLMRVHALRDIVFAGDLGL